MPETAFDLSEINPKFYRKLGQHFQNEPQDESPDLTRKHIPIFKDEIHDDLQEYASELISVDDFNVVVLKDNYQAFIVGKKLEDTREQIWFLIDDPDNPDFQEVYFVHVIDFLSGDLILEVVKKIEFSQIDPIVLRTTHDIINHAVASNAINSLESE